MAKVYVLTVGQYSDYRLIGVFSNRTDADQLISTGNPAPSQCYNIHEVILDEKVGWVCGKVWTSRCALDGGMSITGPPDTDFRRPSHCLVRFLTKRGEIEVESSISRQHAAKTAVEKRQEFLRCQAEGTLPEWAQRV